MNDCYETLVALLQARERRVLAQLQGHEVIAKLIQERWELRDGTVVWMPYVLG